MRETTPTGFVASKKCKVCYGRGEYVRLEQGRFPMLDEHCGQCVWLGRPCGDHWWHERRVVERCRCVRGTYGRRGAGT